MDYKEKYKAALERAKQFSEKPLLEDSAGIVEYIFPELKEPELAELKDERIMKALIHFFSNDENTSFEYWEGIPKAEVLAWLKKQGRVKESTIPQHENKTCKENNDSLTCEDERIKNEIIAFVEQSIHRGGGTPIPQEQENKWIAWLEKHGEQKETLCDKCKKEQPSHSCQDITALGRCAIEKQGGIDNVPLEGSTNIIITDSKKSQRMTSAEAKEALFDYSNATIQQKDFAPKFDSLILSNSQNIGKPFDYENANIQQKDFAPKAEPKFRVGNWYQCTKDFFGKGVTFDKNTAYYCAKEGCLQNEYGCHIAIVKDLYDNFKLWTIQDAKSGDVLYTPKGCGVEGIFLIEGWKQVDDTGRTLCSDIGYRIEDDEIIAGGLGAIWWKGVIDPFYPATKEQRDLLFQKMHESGYEWDAEKKELKKIENKNPLLSDFFKAEYERGKADAQKSSWSEEDEKHYQGCLNLMKLSLDTKPYPYYNDYLWLKSLKDKVQPQPKQEWSEEDEEHIESILKRLDGMCKKGATFTETRFAVNQDMDWIKSLKDRVQPQSHWKPTKVQLELLKEACDKRWEPDGLDPLYTLWEHLKSL